MLDFHDLESSKFKHLFRFARKSAFCLCFSSLTLMAEGAYAQNAKVTINQKNVRIESILNDIESQTDYLFIYKKDVDVKKLKTISVQNKPAPGKQKETTSSLCTAKIRSKPENPNPGKR